MLDLVAIAARYGGSVCQGSAVIPTPGHSRADRGTYITPSPTAPEGALVHCFNGTHSDALAVKGMLRRDGFLPPREGETPLRRSELQISKAMLDRRARDREAKVRGARAIWGWSIPARDTLAHVYLKSRGIKIAPPSDIRFARLRFAGPAPLPCLIAGVRDLSGVLIGIQRIWLASDGRGKAAVETPKKSLGRVKGGAIQVGQLGRSTSLMICEGPETGLSLLQLYGGPVWVATGAMFLPTMQLPPQVRTVVIAADNDAVGIAKAREASLRFKRLGHSVRIIRPAAPFNDFNDQLRYGDRR